MIAIGSLLLLPLGGASAAAPWTITTVTGSPSGLYGFSGDGGPAVAALLHNQGGIAVDPQGDLFIADTYNYRVRKVGPEGTISTIAGFGAYGNTGDGGPATFALLVPTGVAVDGAGDVYVSDCDHNVIRRVDTAGTITTVAGTGAIGYSGDGGPATSAMLRCPAAMTFDGQGDLYFSDFKNNRVRMITPGGTISTVAGDGLSSNSGDGGPATSVGLSPMGLAFGPTEDLFIADGWANKVRKVTPGGTISTIAGTGEYKNTGDGGPATSASLRYPGGIDVDADGDIFVATLCQVREIAPTGTITTIAGGPECGISGDGCAATMGRYLGAQGGVAIPLALDGRGDVLLSDYSANNIREIEPTEPPASCSESGAGSTGGGSQSGSAGAGGSGSHEGSSAEPKVHITAHPPKETTDRSAIFSFTGTARGSFECSVDGAWRPCASGDSFGPLQPGDHRFEVREILQGETSAPDSWSWTVDLPKACILKVARARVFAFTHQEKARLIIHYKAYKPARVTVSYSLEGPKGGLGLGTASTRFKAAGIFRLGVGLDKAETAKLKAATSMKVRFSIPSAPSSCTRYYKKRLTIPKKMFGQTVWFQSDSKFASAGSGL